MPLLVSLSGEGTSSPSARAAESPSTAPTCSSAAAARTARRRSPRCSRPPREQASTAARTSRLWGRSASSSGWPWRQPLRTRPEATYSDLPVLLPLFPVPFEDQKRRERLKPFAALISPPTSTFALTGHREGSAESCACPTPSCALHFGPGASPMPPAAVHVLAPHPRAASSLPTWTISWHQPSSARSRPGGGGRLDLEQLVP